MSRRPWIVAFFLTTGCYQQRPLTTTPAPNAELRVTLTDSGTLLLAPQLGPNVGELAGRLVAVRGDSIELSLLEVRLRNGDALYQRGVRATFARSDASRIAVRTLDRRRTLLALIGGTFGAAAIAATAANAGAFGGNDGGGVVTPP